MRSLYFVRPIFLLSRGSVTLADICSGSLVRAVSIWMGTNMSVLFNWPFTSWSLDSIIWCSGPFGVERAGIWIWDWRLLWKWRSRDWPHKTAPHSHSVTLIYVSNFTALLKSNPATTPTPPCNCCLLASPSWMFLHIRTNPRRDRSCPLWNHPLCLSLFKS